MKLVKITFITVEIASLMAVILLAFFKPETSDAELFKSLYIIMFTLLAVAMQKEQQELDWEESENEC